MSFFKGQELFSLDNKGRVIIPAKMRKCIIPEAKDTFNITRGEEQCIYCYPMDKWGELEQRLDKLSYQDPKIRYYLRVLLMWSDEATLDNQQRIIIPKRHLEFAGIDNKVLIVGVRDHIELWNPDEYEKYLDSQNQTYTDIAAEMLAF